MDATPTKTIDQIVLLLKLAPEYLWAILATLIVVIFVPDKLLFVSGIVEFRENFNQFLAPALVLVVSLLVTIPIHSKLQRHKKMSRLKSYLGKLTDGEKLILSRFIAGKKRTQVFEISDGNVLALAQNRVIVRGASCLRRAGFIKYNIQNWAWDYLNKNKQLLIVSEDDENA